MAGMPGRSGGPRPGSGRKPKVAAPAGTSEPVQDPLDYLMSVVNDPDADAALRVRAATAAAQYIHTRTKDGGKKDRQQADAEGVASGRFAPKAPPKLAAVK